MTKHLPVERMDEEVLWDALGMYKQALRKRMNEPQTEEEVERLDALIKRAVRLRAELVEL